MPFLIAAIAAFLQSAVCGAIGYGYDMADIQIIAVCMAIGAAFFAIMSAILELEIVRS